MTDKHEIYDKVSRVYVPNAGAIRMHFMLMHPYPEDLDPKGWHMSEKLDGVRGMAVNNCLLTRNNKRLMPPDWWIGNWSRGLKLDGELYVLGIPLEEISGMLNSRDCDWTRVQFRVFDLVSPMRIEDRFDRMYQVVRNIGPHVQSVEQTTCQGVEHLHKFYNMIHKCGGEGVILRMPGSFYEHERSYTALKYVPDQFAEGIVTGYTEGTGKFSGLMGAMEIAYQDYKFKLGTGFSDTMRAAPPPIGSEVQFKYKRITSQGAPRNASFVKLIKDES